MNIIPFNTPGSWQMQISLTQQIFLLNFTWNALNEYWLMDIADGNNNPIVYGIVIVPNFDITAQFVVVGMPAGDILCQNISGEWGPIGRFDMGETCELIYYEPGEANLPAQDLSRSV
jgi:hypothetical protein